VEVALAGKGVTAVREAVYDTDGGNAEENPSYSFFQGGSTYFFNTMDSTEPSTCEGRDADSFRICCCGAIEDCPVSDE
jgi:hypothetical protein